MKLHLSTPICALVAFQTFAGATRLSLSGTPRRSSESSTVLRKRASVSGTSGLNDTTDVQYTTPVTLNGQAFQALIDTGSSDLWVAGSVSNAVDTGKTSGVSYAVGEVEGPVKTAQMQFAGFTVDNQAYLEITPDQNNVKGSGLIGLGPHTGSEILTAIGNSAGDPPLDRIFRQNMTTPNFLTLLLSRSDDPDEKFPGELTVGEVVPGFEAVSNQPKLGVSVLSAAQSPGQHFSTFLDKDGIIGPDGKNIPIKSEVSGAGDLATVIFDSGFTLPQVPKSVSDAIYSGVSGAKFINVTGLGPIWTLPCDQELNISFVFSGQKYPIHPLDTNLNGTDLQITTSDGSNVCIGAFQPVSFDSSFGGSGPLFDMIMGMAFLRNAYISINFGDFVDGTTNTADPYIQLLSTTNDSANAHQDFVKVRLGGKDTTVNKSGSGSGSSSSSKTSNIRKIAIIASGAAGVLLIILGGICICCSKRKNKTVTTGGVMGFGGRTYQPLNEPAPGAATETYALPNLGYNQQYNASQPQFSGGPQAYQSPYQVPQHPYETAWDHRT